MLVSPPYPRPAQGSRPAHGELKSANDDEYAKRLVLNNGGMPSGWAQSSNQQPPRLPPTSCVAWPYSTHLMPTRSPSGVRPAREGGQGGRRGSSEAARVRQQLQQQGQAESD